MPHVPSVPSVPVRKLPRRIARLASEELWLRQLGISDLLMWEHAGFWYAAFRAVMAYLGHAGEQLSQRRTHRTGREYC